MSVYQRVLDIARDQAAALSRGELESAVALLDDRAELLVGAVPPHPDEVALVEEVLRLDRNLASAIRERMISIRNEALGGRQGQRALSSYGRRLAGRPIAIDRSS